MGQTLEGFGLRGVYSRAGVHVFEAYAPKGHSYGREIRLIHLDRGTPLRFTFTLTGTLSLVLISFNFLLRELSCFC